MLGFTPFYPTQKITEVSALMKYILSPLLAPPSIPPQRREEKDKLLILEGVGGGVLVPHNIGKCCISYDKSEDGKVPANVGFHSVLPNLQFFENST
ncbi:MAG: hypothetical protein AN487_19240 [Anabaena sp. CRKS33]|nr:MAG: hypothetical protein AN487_19240 [Anabaena sp. CRKS33]